jgi:hypothetical protein
MKNLKMFFFLFVLSIGIILSSSLVLAQQPSDSVKIVEVDYKPPVVVTLDHTSSGYDITIITNATLQSSITPTNNHPDYTIVGEFNWTINTTSAAVSPPVYAFLNLSMPADSSSITVSILGTTGSNTTIVNITETNWIGNILNVTLKFNDNSTIALLSLNFEWNVTISTDSSVTQVTAQPLVAIDETNSSDVEYVQNFTVTAPFINNVTANVTVPDANITITSITGNSTSYVGPLPEISFDIYNVSTGTSPQVNMKAEKLIYLTITKHKEQGAAMINQNVTWTSNYTIAYNSSSFSNLIAENVVLNHTLWPDSDIGTANITVETGV